MLTYKETYDGEPIAAKNGLRPEEQEVGIIIRAESDKALIDSHIPAVTKALLGLPFFEVERVELSGEKRKHVVGVAGTIPVGAISIKQPRRSNHPSRVVSGWQIDPKFVDGSDKSGGINRELKVSRTNTRRGSSKA